MRGRLDNYWTEHLRSNLDGVIRGGAHGLSSESVRSLVSQLGWHRIAGAVLQPLKNIGGSLVITSPSDRVKLILDMCKLSPILLGREQLPIAAPHTWRKFAVSRRHLASFEVLECAPERR